MTNPTAHTRSGTVTNRRRSIVASVLICLIAVLGLSACQTAKAGTKCRSGAAQDSTYVLLCKKGHWIRWITKAEGQKMLDRLNHSGPTHGDPAPPHGTDSSTPPSSSSSSTPSSSTTPTPPKVPGGMPKPPAPPVLPR